MSVAAEAAPWATYGDLRFSRAGNEGLATAGRLASDTFRPADTVLVTPAGVMYRNLLFAVGVTRLRMPVRAAKSDVVSLDDWGRSTGAGDLLT